MAAHKGKPIGGLIKDKRAKGRFWRLKSYAKVLGAGLCVLCVGRFAASSWDSVVVSNLLFRSTKILDVVFRPSTEDAALPHIKKYLDARWDEIRGRRRDFALWDYFDLRDALAARGRRPRKWSELVVARMELWAAKLGATGDKRFTIEKDKCVMLDMLKMLRLPHPRVRRTWMEDEYDAGELRAYLLAQAYPAILKVGHIHQQKSTLFLPDADSVTARVDEFVSWVSAKMRVKFDDGSAMWAKSTNKLYAVTDPCLIVQDVVNPKAFVGARADGNALRPVELLVEVVWGVPMHAVAIVSIRGEMILGKAQRKAQHQDTVEFLVRRDGWACYKWPKINAPGAFFSKWYVNRHSHVRLHRKLQETWFKTRDPTRGDRGWRKTCAGLRAFERRACKSEYRVAQTLFWAKYGALASHLPKVGADYLRCDVFVAPDGDVSLNEISLSSYWGNTLSDAWQTRFLDLWIDGYGAPPNDDDELLAPNEGGAAFETTFTGPLPSPTYLVRQGSTTLLGGKLPVKTSDLEGEPRGGAFLTWP
ncbi:hypothetical protein SO694_00042152 [Aureococcus anophagefferens]|uniref:Uncharacterized protein n=1 Tax=Aureococcus anophagefferens TaxID=44056 RepID=A0ABR1G6B4_AURAN